MAKNSQPILARDLLTMRQLTITKIEFDSNRREINKYVYKVIHLNSQNKFLDETEYDSDSTILSRITNRFSKTGSIIEQNVYDSFNALLERQTFFEDEDGVLIKSILEYGDGSKEIKDFNLTELGNADKVTVTNENGELIGYETSVFNENGEVISEIESDSDHNEISRYEKAYSESGLLIEEKFFIEGELEHIEKFKYNEQKLVREILKLRADNSKIQHELIEYDSNNNEIKRIIRNYDENYETIENYEYDENSNMLINTVFTNGRMVFENLSTYYADNSIKSEEIMEIDWSGIISRHEKLIHEYNK